MCGIAGMLSYDGPPPTQEALSRMLATLVHRGPDDEGQHVDGPVALGARRLSILDVEGGHQPISNEDGSVWAVQNGEIYNYRELREQLLSRGHRLRTTSDTETLVHLYEDAGDDFLAELRGMFALALWDARRRRLLLARDRLGIKPLYVHENAAGLVFGSELKALLASGRVPREIDPAAVRDYAQLLYVPAPAAIFRGVRKLRPGRLLVAEAGGSRERAYWALGGEPSDRAPLEDQLERFRDLFEESVALHMRSDVPYGAFLSGGIDSSAVVGTMARLQPAPVRTFSIGFRSGRFDERHWARLVSRRFGTQHEEFVVEPDAFSLLGPLGESFDEPFADAAFLPTYVLSGLARRQVKVVLTGDGGDELFAGYDRHRFERWAELAARLPRLLRRGLLAPLLGALRLPADWRSADVLRLARRKLDLLEHPSDERYARNFLSWSPAEFRALAGPALRAAGDGELPRRFAGVMAEVPGADFIGRRLRLDTLTWLPDQMLTKVDRATMAQSLEARVPFLDQRLVEFAFALPEESKFAFATLKRFLKLAFAELLPAELLRRPKHGFEVPIDEWLRGPLRERLRDELQPARLARHGFFEPAFVGRLLAEHEQRRRNRSRELFLLLVFELWYSRWTASA
ncbi:MAG: asparagine synthase (glutamine-hydrolyzing) [Vicinamibacteria bacterium]